MQKRQQELQSEKIMQLQSLSLFDVDPLSPDCSFDCSQDIPIHPLHYLPQEELLSENHYPILLKGDSKSLKEGQELIITNYRLAFYQINAKENGEINAGNKIEENCLPISLPYGFMEQIDIEKKQIIIKTRMGMIYKIKPFSDLQKIYQTILFGCTHLPFFIKNSLQLQESLSYDCLAEMQRMRMDWQSYKVVKNPKGTLCPTYPKYFVVSKRIQHNLLEQCLKIRNGSRIPVLSYYSYSFKSGLWRAATAKVNQQNNKYNSTYLKNMSRDLYIIDLRDQQLTFREKDEINFYIRFADLTTVNNIFQKIIISYTKDASVLKVIGKWYQDVLSLLKCAYQAVQQLKAGKQVLLQQDMSFDRVCQVSALVQIIIDPFYRTMHGFSLLVQKQFVSFGHPFSRRLGYQRQKIHQSSPIYIQFLQCIHQLIVTHPCCFQFSSFYIARLAYEAYTTKYNNFFFNTPQERANSKFISKTPNIWKNLPLRKEYYNYQWIEKEAVKQLSSLRPIPSQKQFIIWRQFYDMVSEMKAEMPQLTNVKPRRCSIYNLMHKKTFEKMI